MKIFLSILTIFIFLTANVYAQDSARFFIDEYSFSVNRSGEQYSEKTKKGYGAGLYHTFLKDKHVNLLFGVEYNRTHQYQDYNHGSPSYSYNNLYYDLQYISFPLNLRAVLGNKFKVFMELGVFHEFLFSSTVKGQTAGFSGVRDFTRKRDGSLLNVGYSAGAGIKVAVGEKYELLVKPEFKYGLLNVSHGFEAYNRYMRMYVAFGLR